MPLRCDRSVVQALRKLGHATPEPKEPAISTSIFVGNLSFEFTEQELLEAFKSVGQIVRARIVKDRETGRSRGFAFVEFSSDPEAEEAIRRFDGQPLGGRTLRVSPAETRRPHGAGPRPQFNQGPDPGSYDSESDSGFGAARRFKAKGSRRRLRGRKRSLR